MLDRIVFQQREGACGPAALKIALERFGIIKTEKELIRLSKCNPSRGVEATSLLRVAKKLGLKGFIRDNSDFKEVKEYLKKGNYVIIVDWFLEDDGHFGIISNIDKENVYIQDPDLGHIRAIRLDIFKRIWFSFPGKYMKTRQDLILRRMLVIYR